MPCGDGSEAAAGLVAGILVLVLFVHVSVQRSVASPAIVVIVDVVFVLWLLCVCVCVFVCCMWSVHVVCERQKKGGKREEKEEKRGSQLRERRRDCMFHDVTVVACTYRHDFYCIRGSLSITPLHHSLSGLSHSRRMCQRLSATNRATSAATPLISLDCGSLSLTHSCICHDARSKQRLTRHQGQAKA